MLQMPLRWAWASQSGLGWPSMRPKAGLPTGTQCGPCVWAAECVRPVRAALAHLPQSPGEGAEGYGETLAGCGRSVAGLPCHPTRAVMALEGFLALERGLSWAGGPRSGHWSQWQPQARTTMLRCLRRMTLLLLS